MLTIPDFDVPAIVLESVGKRFRSRGRDVWALKNLTIHINPGEFLAVLGPSGAGKTTLLRLIAGLDLASTGIIRIDGIDVTRAGHATRDAAMVFQSGALFPHMNVAENLGFGLKLRHVPQAEIKARVEETAAMLGLSDSLLAHSGELSGGQRQRVALGRAIIRRPKILLLDEPLSSLDPHLRAGLRREIARIHSTLKTTVVYVTHDQIQATRLASRIAIVSDGILHQIGTTRELMTNPATDFVAKFLSDHEESSPAPNL